MSQLVHNIKNGNRKYHQIYTIDLGTEELIKCDCQVIAKIRTDYFLDVNALHKAVKNKHHEIFTLFLTATMKDLTKAYLSDSQINEDTHYDYFYKFTKYLVSNDNKNDNSIIRNQLSKRFFTYFVWTSYLYPIDLEVFKSLSWRGLKVNHRLNYWVRLFYIIKCAKGKLLIPSVAFNFLYNKCIESFPKT